MSELEKKKLHKADAERPQLCRNIEEEEIPNQQSSKDGWQNLCINLNLSTY